MADEVDLWTPCIYAVVWDGGPKEEIICRYKIIISLIDKKMVDDFARKQGITLVEHNEISARWMANLIAVQRAIKEVDAKKIISFHSRVDLAQEFATNQPQGIAYHLCEYDVRHVNGKQNSRARSAEISFAHLRIVSKERY